MTWRPASAVTMSPEQDAVIRAGYAAGDDMTTIIAACLAVPGRRDLKPTAIIHRARKLKIIRPVGWRRGLMLRVKARLRAETGDRRNVPSRVRRRVGKPDDVWPRQATATSHAVPLRELIRIGRDLGLRGDACLDAERVSKAARQVDPTCAGYRLVSLGSTPRVTEPTW